MSTRTFPDTWRPTADLEGLRKRSEVIASIRKFFFDRGLLEVDTPALCRATVTDLHLHSLATAATVLGIEEPVELFLQTSPEYAMKRLLAAGYGPVFQICKAFRDQEGGRLHNTEFTMLEWYRPGWDHHLLMDEIDELLAVVLGVSPAQRMTYREALSRYAGVADAHGADAAELRSNALDRGVNDVPGLDRNGWLSLIMTQVVEPAMVGDPPIFLFDYPADQAALARIRPGSPPVAERFELYVNGLELANGFRELTDHVEQLRRFETDNSARIAAGLPAVRIDENFLGALEHGLPDCAGVALGVDRLVMLAVGATSIDEVIAFPTDRA